MGNIHLVTGCAGAEHITSADQGAFNAALIGTGQFVLEKGNSLSVQVISNNQIRVLDGELMMQGRFVRLEPGTYVDLAIDNGEQGKLRNDLIAARYTKDASTGFESVDLVVIKGSAAASNPVDPAVTEGDITDGAATLHEFPLWRIPLDGLNIGTPVALFGEPFMDSMRTLPEIRHSVETIHKEVDDQLADYDVQMEEKIAAIVSYTKEETLSEETKALYGLDETGTPDDVFALIKTSPTTILETVWENASQGSSFGEQTISVDLSAYDMVAIEAHDVSLQQSNGTQPLSAQIQLFKKNIGKCASLVSYTTARKYSDNGYYQGSMSYNFRHATVSDGKVAFGLGYQVHCTGGSTGQWSGVVNLSSIYLKDNNSVCVPVKIYGVKGAKFA